MEKQNRAGVKKKYFGSNTLPEKGRPKVIYGEREFLLIM
jgi:hypothetical protein